MDINAKTAAKRKHEAIAAADRGEFGEAARCFLWASEAYAKAGFDVGAAEMREISGVYQRLRDKHQPNVK